MDMIFTVCCNAAGEECPVWLGHPVTAHWGGDPAACTGSEAEQNKVFEEACQRLTNRIKLLISLPIAKLDSAILKEALQAIGNA